MARKLVGCLVVAAAVGMLAGAASAQFAKPEDAVRYRQSVMFLMGEHFTRMAAMIKGDVPYDKAAFEKNAVLVDTLYGMPIVDAFTTPGSDKGSGMKSDALKEKDKVTQLHNATLAELDKLAAAARSGDLSAIKTRFGAAAGSCTACHRAYRK